MMPLCPEVAPKAERRGGLGRKKGDNLHKKKMYRMLEQRHPSEMSLKMPQECVDFWHDGISSGDLFWRNGIHNLGLTKKKKNQGSPLETDWFHANVKIWLIGNRASFQVANMNLCKSLSPPATKTDNPVRKAINYAT